MLNCWVISQKHHDHIFSGVGALISAGMERQPGLGLGERLDLGIMK
jgi:hypothetical protein